MKNVFHQFLGHEDPATRRELDQIVGAWRSAQAGPGGGERLSDAARSRVLAGVRRRAAGEDLPPQRALFVPLGRLVFAGALPALAVTALLVAAVLPSMQGDPAARVSDDAPIGLQVDKQGGELVILIANGGGPHRIRRSTDARGLRGQVFSTSGAFRDRLEGDSQLVFYRVD